MTELPTITIGITCFNAEHSVALAVDSALQQTWLKKEIVIVDDCSSDSSWQRLEEMARSYDGVRIHRNEKNLGVAGARNRILEHAKGDFVAFFDDDDVSLPDRLQVQYDRIVNYQLTFADGADVLSYSARQVRYPDGESRLELPMGCFEEGVAPNANEIVQFILAGRQIRSPGQAGGACPTCSLMGRKAVFDRLGGFDEQFRRSEDTELNVRLGLAGGHIVGISEPLVRQNMTLTSDKSVEDEFFYTRMMLDKHRNVLDNAGHHEFCCRWLNLKQNWYQRSRVATIRSFIGLVLRHPKLTARRFAHAMRNRKLNQDFRRFHSLAKS